MFGKFDKLILMSEGKIIYNNDAHAAIEYFGKITFDGVRFKCPDHSNPADFFMEIMSKESMVV